MVSGTGTSGDPFILSSLSDLELIGTTGYALSAYYKLGADIDASGTAAPEYNSGAGWAPIGTFTGNFDGDEKTISGLYINRSSTNNIGLFSIAGNGANIYNFTLSNVDITGQDNVGSFVGYINGAVIIITDCLASGEINGASYTGGVFGSSANSSGVSSQITTCSFSGTVNCSGNYLGGISGAQMAYATGTTINGCTVSGTINGNSASGSYASCVTGRARKDVVNCSVTNCTLNASTYNDVGGIVGDQVSAGTLDNNSITDSTIYGKEYTGGILGNAGSQNTIITISDSIVDAYVSGTQYVGGIAGLFAAYASGAGISNCSVIGTVKATVDAVGGIVGYVRSSISDCHITPELTFDASNADRVGGIFGALVASLNVSNCSVRNTISGDDKVGGIFGDAGGNNTLTISECYFLGSISGTNYCGGIGGYSNAYSASSSIEKCYTSGNITVSTNYAGGLYGWSRTNITNCYSNASVSGVQYVGGFVGQVYEYTLTKSYSNGSVTGTNDVGGLVGNAGSGSASDCFWDTQASGQANSALGTGKTTAEMKTESTYTNWDFSTPIWIIETYPNEGYPFLLSPPLYNIISETETPSGVDEPSIGGQPDPISIEDNGEDSETAIWAGTMSLLLDDSGEDSDDDIFGVRKLVSEGWGYYSDILYTEAETDNPYDYTIKSITITYEDFMNTDFSDIRFVFRGEYCYYCLSEKTDEVSAIFDVRIPSIGIGQEVILRVYAGNNKATSTSDGFNTYLFFDDFEDGEIGQPAGPEAIKVADDPVKYEAWPSLAKLSDGTLLLSYRVSDTAVHNYSPTGKIRMITSSDNGETWSEETTIASLPGTDLRDGGTVVFDDDGVETIIRTFSALEDDSDRYIGYVKSIDGGETWGDLVIIRSARVTVNNPVCLSNGVILIPTYHPTTAGVYVERSTDNGDTWNEITICTDDHNEATIIETKNGNGDFVGGVLVVMRTLTTQYYKVTSTDYGATWGSTSLISEITTQIATKCALARLNDDTLGLAYTTSDVVVSLSTDEGNNWSDVVTVYDTPTFNSEYPDLIALDSENMLVSWCDNFHSYPYTSDVYVKAMPLDYVPPEVPDYTWDATGGRGTMSIESSNPINGSYSLKHTGSSALGQGQTEDYSYGILLDDFSSLNNYIEFDVKLLQQDTMVTYGPYIHLLYFNFVNYSNVMALTTYYDTNNSKQVLRITKIYNYSPTTYGVNSTWLDHKWAVGEAIHFKVLNTGNHIKVWTDGTLVIDTDYTFGMGSNIIGINVPRDGIAEWDDFRIYPYVTDEPTLGEAGEWENTPNPEFFDYGVGEEELINYMPLLFDDSGCLIDYEELKLFKEANDTATDNETLNINNSITMLEAMEDYKKNILPANIADCTDTLGTTAGFTNYVLGGSISTSTDETYTGTRSLKVSVLGEGAVEGGNTSLIPVQAGFTYVYSGRYKIPAGKQVRAQIGSTLTIITGTGDWQYFSLGYTPGGTTTTIYFVTPSNQGAFEFYVDELMVEKGSSATAWKPGNMLNYIQQTVDTAVTGLSAAYATPVLDTTDYYQGSGSCKAVKGSTGKYVAINHYGSRATATPGKLYLGMVKTKTDREIGGQVYVKFYDSQAIEGYPFNTLTLNTGWQNALCIARAPPTATTCVLNIQTNQTAVEGTTIWWDDAWLVELPEDSMEALELLNMMTLNDTATDSENIPSLVNRFTMLDRSKNCVIPNVATGTDIYQASNGFAKWKGTETVTSTTEESYFGERSLKVETPGNVAGEGTSFTSYGLAANATYTTSAWVKAPIGVTFQITRDFGGATAFEGTGQWERVFITAGTSGITQGQSGVTSKIRTTYTAQSTTFYVDGVQTEPGDISDWTYPGGMDEIASISNQFTLSDDGAGNDVLSSLLVMLSLTDSNISVGEALSLFSRLSITDSGVINELPSLKNSFALNENLIGVTDIYPIHNFLGVSESNTILESLHVALETVVNDDGFSNELVEVFIRLMLLENAFGDDNIALTVYTLLNDYGSASEAVRKELIKIIGGLIFIKQKNIELEFTNEKTFDVER